MIDEQSSVANALSVLVELKNNSSGLPIKKPISIDSKNLSLAKFVRQVLRRMRIPMKNADALSLSMTHMGISIKIESDEDLAFIIRGQLLCEEQVEASLAFSGVQVASSRRLGKQQIEFNEEGEKISQEFAMNEPSDPRYKEKIVNKRKIDRNHDTGTSGVMQHNDEQEGEEGSSIVCAFCQENIRNLEAIKKLGWFYGPFKHKKREYYTHLMCAIWSPNVFLDEKTNRMRNVKQEIQRSKKIICKECGQSGAGLGCVVKDCKMSYHFKCALSDALDTRLDHEKYLLYCHNHGHILDDRVAQQIENVHCEKCKIDEKEDLILLCDNCNKGFHTFCLDKPLPGIPDGDWFCAECETTRQASKIY